MTNKKIYIACPAGYFSGGPTLLHQLCSHLNNLKIDAKIFYFKIKKRNLEVHSQYKSLNLPYTFNLDDDASNVIIVPETSTHLLKPYIKSKGYIWWLSVDNYFQSRNNYFLLANKLLSHFGLPARIGFSKKFLSKFDHLSQSHYATEFLRNHNIFPKPLGDYLSPIFLDENLSQRQAGRFNFVAYNPAKGYRFTKKLIRQCADIEFRSIAGLPPEAVVDTLLSAKVYIDFGNHPGKDRLPREAAACGCCVITGRRGAANNDVDIPIPTEYKFAETDIENIKKMLLDCLSNYSSHQKNFTSYTEKIHSEKTIFEQQVKNVFL